MTFTTYDVNLTLDRDKIRFEIGDTQENTSGSLGGPRPDKRNFADEEIAAILTDEGSNNGAIAHLFEVLLAEWTRYALSEKEGQVSIDAKETADSYRKLSTEWRSKAGDGSNTIFAGVISLDFQQTDTVTDK